MNGAEFGPGAFRALVPAVSPSLISDFLDHCGWVLAERHEGLAEYWHEPGSSKSPALLLPLNEEMRDFERRLAEMLAGLGRYFHEDAPHLLQRIDRVNWDTLVLRTGSTDHDDSVSIIHATKMLDVGMEIMRRAALYTFNPHRINWGKNQSPRVTDYLQNSVRLGHTERGSFIFPILSRVGTRDVGGSAFGRQVMANLAQALSRVHHWSGEEPRQEFGTSPFDLAIAGPLASVAEMPGFNGLSISFRWAPARSLPPHLSPVSLDFNTDFTEAVKAAARSSETPRLTRHLDEDASASDESAIPPRGWVSHTPRLPALTTRPPESRVSGHVISIGVDDRNEEHYESPFFIVLRSAHGDVWVSVTEDDYDFAMRARIDRRQVTAVGKLLNREDRRTLRGSLIRPGHHPASGRSR